MRLPNFPQSELTTEQQDFAATVSQVRQQAEAEVKTRVMDVNMRRWCVDQALKAFNNELDSPQILRELIHVIYEFVGGMEKGAAD